MVKHKQKHGAMKEMTNFRTKVVLLAYPFTAEVDSVLVYIKLDLINFLMTFWEKH